MKPKIKELIVLVSACTTLSFLLSSIVAGSIIGFTGFFWVRWHLEKSKKKTGSTSEPIKLRVRNHRYWIKLIQKWLFLWNFKRVFPLPARERNCYLLGQTGSGKSELIKQMVYNDLHYPCGVLVIDPHEQLVSQIARLKVFAGKFRNKLVYLSPEFFEDGFLPCINPFEHNFHKLPKLKRIKLISQKVGEIMEAFTVIFRESGFTPNMDILLRNGTRLLLEQNEATLLDLVDLLSPGNEEKYFQMGKRHSNEQVRQFFADVYKQERIRATKLALYVRLSVVLDNEPLKIMLGSYRSTLNIPKLLNSGKKVILINASQETFTADGTRILGAFLTSQIANFALTRNDPTWRPKIMVYLDEAQTILSNRASKALSETRKYGVHWTLAHQYMGQLMGEKLTGLKGAIMANTNVKIIGSSSFQDAETMSRNTGIDLKSVPPLALGRFALKVGIRPGEIYVAPNFLVSNKGMEKHKYYMTNAQFQEVMIDQKANYYRSHIEFPTAIPLSPLSTKLSSDNIPKPISIPDEILIPKINKLI